MTGPHPAEAGLARRQVPHAPRAQPVPRVQGPIESEWERARGRTGGREAISRRLRALPMPIITEDDPPSPTCRYTWVHEDAEASAIVLSANHLVDPDDLSRSELTRLAHSDWWTITYRLPREWRASYVLTPHHGTSEPPWRAATGPRETRLAAMAGEPDPANPRRIATSRGPASVVEGPAAPPHPWRGPALGRSLPRRRFPATAQHRERTVFIYRPGRPDAPPEGLPLLVLFDGEWWSGPIPLAESLDAAIQDGAIAPLCVAMIDSTSTEHRWHELGVPGGTVDFVLDELLPALREEFPISRDPRDVVASGSSLGGLASLWLLARGSGRVGGAIAQSPSLWRDDVTEPLRAASGYRLEIQAGEYESAEMLPRSERLVLDLVRAGREASLTPVCGGHDWAWWHPGLLAALERMFPGS